MTPAATSPFRLAVFDVAGTTVIDGAAVGACLHEALGGGVAISLEDVNRVMGLPKPVAIRQLLSAAGAFDGEALDRAVDRAHRKFTASLIERYQQDGAIAPAEGAERVFAALREAGIRVVLDTGFGRDILDTVLEGVGWSEGTTIDFAIASDEVDRGRPYPDLIHRAMALTHIPDPRQVAKIGDTPSDLMEGLAAECGLVVGVTYGTHTVQQLERPGVRIIDRLLDLLPLMGIDAL